jgi:CheY-like chemotaxis protein
VDNSSRRGLIIGTIVRPIVAIAAELTRISHPLHQLIQLQTSDHVPVALKTCPILIVEDDADLREMMAQLLALEGFDAATAANGREALDYLRHHAAPKLILLDLMMPVMDGWEFRREQQLDASIAHVPVVVLSALDRGRANDVIADDFLKKPLDFDRLVEVVRSYCG